MIIDDKGFGRLVEQARDRVKKAHTAEGIYEMQVDLVCRKLAKELVDHNEQYIYEWFMSKMYLNEDFGVIDPIISFHKYFKWEV